MALNGVVLLSSILNWLRLPGLDNDYVNLLPTFAATAWYHSKLMNKPTTLEPFLTQVREFARRLRRRAEQRDRISATPSATQSPSAWRSTPASAWRI